MGNKISIDKHVSDLKDLLEVNLDILKNFENTIP